MELEEVKLIRICGTEYQKEESYRERQRQKETEFCKGAPPLLNKYFLHMSDRKILRLRK